MSAHNFIDRTGQTFGRLTVLERVENNNHKKACWECRCSCGNIIIVTGCSLKTGNTQSCGCLKKELELIRPITHGMSKSREYIIWTHMISRCFNVSDKVFKHYGGRGITICDEWRHDFMAFYRHIGRRPSPKHSIDRIDNDGNYEPGNVRWATIQQQNNNSRNTRNITLHGWTMTLSNWARFVGLKRETLLCRMDRSGWPVVKTIFQKVNHIK